jgi:hypothetical protein
MMDVVGLLPPTKKFGHPDCSTHQEPHIRATAVGTEAHGCLTLTALHIRSPIVSTLCDASR